MLKNKQKDSAGLSTIVGVILMVSLAILLAALISQFSLELSEILQQPVTAGVNIQESYNVQEDTYDVRITWSNGGTVSSIHAVEPDGSQTPTMDEIGQDIEIDDVESGERIRIIGTLDSGQSGVIQEYTVG